MNFSQDFKVWFRVARLIFGEAFLAMLTIAGCTLFAVAWGGLAFGILKMVMPLGEATFSGIVVGVGACIVIGVRVASLNIDRQHLIADTRDQIIKEEQARDVCSNGQLSLPEGKCE